MKKSVLPMINTTLIVILLASNIYLWIVTINLNKEVKELNGNQTTETKKEVEFKNILPSEIAKESEDETIVVMVGRVDCGWCQRFEPVLKNVAKDYNFTPRYIDLYKIVDNSTWQISNEDEYNALANLDAVEGKETFIEENFGSTPLTMIIKDNKIQDAFAGYVDENTLNDILNQNGFSK